MLAVTEIRDFFPILNLLTSDFHSNFSHAHTHQFQVLLKNVPCWLHHFKHHVILDILYKIQHPLPQCESTSKPRGEITPTQLRASKCHGELSPGLHSQAELNISVLANSLLQHERDYKVNANHLWLFSTYSNSFPSITRIRILNLL